MSDATAWWKKSFTDQTEEIKKRVEARGTSEIDKYFREKLESWKHVKVNIAITGDAGAGKSSFINKLLGYKRNDPRAAPAGHRTNCTYKRQGYSHPENDNIILWDLPGIGTREFPKETYCEKLNLKTYDVFLIFTATRFRQDVSDLIKELAKMGKTFFFVRSKIDQDVDDLEQEEKDDEASPPSKEAEEKEEKEDDNASPPSKEAEEALLKEIRMDCRTQLGDQLSINQQIYLISNKHPKKWDFANLAKDILLVLPEDLSDSLTFSLDILRSLSVDTLKCKVNALKKRVINVAALSALTGAVPFPGVSAVADMGLIYKELTFYRSQLGLPSEGTSTFKTLTETTQAKVKTCLSFLDFALKGTGWLAAYATAAAAEEGVRFIPIVGLAIASAMSYGATYYALKNSLETMEEAALAVIEETAAKTSA